VARIHNYDEYRRREEEAARLPLWDQVLRQFLPSYERTEIVTDRTLQLAGIDRYAYCAWGVRVAIQDKVRYDPWKDILIEGWSDKERDIPGWIYSDLKCQFIAYAILPRRLCYFLPWPGLQRAWQAKKEHWQKAYKPIPAKNKRPDKEYTTLSWGIPIRVLEVALGQRIAVAKWEEQEDKILVGA